MYNGSTKTTPVSPLIFKEKAEKYMKLSDGVRIILPPLACFELTGVKPKPDIMDFAEAFTSKYTNPIDFRQWLFDTKAGDWKTFVRDDPPEMQPMLALGLWFNDMYITHFNSPIVIETGHHRYANIQLGIYLDTCYMEYKTYLANVTTTNENNPGVPISF